MVQEPPISTLPAPALDLTARILTEWAGPPHDPDLSRPALLHQLFEATADAYPQHLALEAAGGGGTYSYGQLDQAANRLAHHLRALGLGPGAQVALLLPRSPEVFVALLAILKAGAAYVPLDPDYPPDRVAYILADSHAAALITTTALAARHSPSPGHTLTLDTLSLGSYPTTRPTPPAASLHASLTAYIIYTSGSTGRPKGVPIPHAAAVNLVRAEGRLFALTPADRVYQGFSIAFDASVEETWLAFASGAALFVASADTIHAGPALSAILTAARITVLSTVPTLLAILTDDIPTLRLLILGGETCPPDLVRRWYQPGRRMVNTYGPTEATVIASYADLSPDVPVTIGRPVPNYRLYILDPLTLQPLPPQTPGELCISGPGLSPGYLHRPDLTAEKFLPNPFCSSPPYHRLYRTGDLAQWTSDGNIDFLGRLDSQVKIRGFRVELCEIEAALMTHPAIQAAAVTLRSDSAIPQLVAYLIPRATPPSSSLDEDALRSHLRALLPSYMIPALFEPVLSFPTLSSGKVDRKSLPAPRPRVSHAATPSDPPRTSLEKKIAATWHQLFFPSAAVDPQASCEAVARSADFFLDLGGHSLLAAHFVSLLRPDPDFHDLSVLDLYNHPTPAQLAAELTRRHSQAPALQSPLPSPRSQASSLKPSSSLRRRHRLCGLAQFLALYLIVGFYSLQWLTPYLTYTSLTERYTPRLLAISYSLAILLALYPTMLLVAIALKWILLGRLKPGSYPLWGTFYFRWWLTQRLLAAIPLDYLVGTPLAPLYFRAMGAKIGKNVFLGSDQLAAFDLLSIGSHSSIGMHASLFAYTIENGALHLGPISIGSHCFVGAASSLQIHSSMAPHSRLGNLSLLPSHTRIPPHQSWQGSPARPLPASSPELSPPSSPAPSLCRTFLFSFLHALGILALPTVYLAAIFPGLLLLNEATHVYGPYYSLLCTPLAALLFIVLLASEIVLVKWLLLGRVKPGTYPLASFFYLRKWFVDQLMDLSLDILGPMYATLYLNPWYRALGAKVGPRAEISTACAASPDLLAIAAEAFVADAVSLGVPYVDAGYLTLATTTIGYRSFVGNSALIPAGTTLGDNTLIGVLTLPPLTLPGATAPDTSWLGSPAIFLPQRQHAAVAFSEQATFTPTKTLVAQRLAIEFLRVTLPLTFFVLLASILISALVSLRVPVWQYVLLFPLLYAAAGLAAAGLVITAKWLLIGRYRPQEQPLWSTFVWRSELLNSLHENLAQPFFTDMLLGTPFLCIFYRALGMTIGPRVLLDSAEFTEFDLVTLGHDAALNAEATIQTHLFEDRVMKMSTITISAHCSIGANSVVLYDSVLHPAAILDDLSLVMKGESLPAHTRWQGTPARHAPAPPPETSPLKVTLHPALLQPA